MAIEFWRMGATPVPVTSIAHFAQDLESQGWNGLAIGEAHGLLPDPYTALAAAAGSTTTLQLGTAVAVPLRAPLLAADAMVSLQALAGGRVRYCVGRGGGGPKIVPKWPISVGDFETYLDQLQQLLRREKVRVFERSISLASLGVIDPSLDLPKAALDVAVTGPKTLAIAARLADGISVSTGASTDALAQAAASAREAWSAAGRDGSHLSLSCFVQVAVVRDDDTSAREAIKGLVLTHAEFANHSSEGHGAEDRTGVRTRTRIPREIDVATDGEPSGGRVDFYPEREDADELIDRFAIVGSPEHCAQRLRAVADLGFQRIYIGTRAVGVDLEERNTRGIGLEVLPLLR
ncbi:MAG: LLM class flavin-dependent oxidoreductase [Acidimicrobiales bacterium]